MPANGYHILLYNCYLVELTHKLSSIIAHLTDEVIECFSDLSCITS